jgi:hypothetical protein
MYSHKVPLPHELVDGSRPPDIQKNQIIILYLMQKTDRKLMGNNNNSFFWTFGDLEYQTSSGPMKMLLFTPNFIEISLSIGQ